MPHLRHPLFCKLAGLILKDSVCLRLLIPILQNQTDKPLNSCYVKLDYCSNCQEEGGPSNQLELTAAGLLEAQTDRTFSEGDAVTTLRRLSSPTVAVIRNAIDSS